MFAAGIVVAGAPGMAATGWFGDVPGVMDPMEPPQVTAAPVSNEKHVGATAAATVSPSAACKLWINVMARRVIVMCLTRIILTGGIVGLERDYPRRRIEAIRVE